MYRSIKKEDLPAGVADLTMPQVFVLLGGMGSSEYSLRGKLILDSGKLAGSYFDRSVILVCRQDETGSFGVVLNRPLGRSLKSASDFPMNDAMKGTPIYTGGPVQQEMLSVLYETHESLENDILPFLQLGHSLQELSDRFDSNQPPRRVRAYSGYAGWTSGQLEEEMRQDCWISLAPTLSAVFCDHPETLWGRMLKKKGGIYQLIAEFPSDPSIN